MEGPSGQSLSTARDLFLTSKESILGVSSALPVQLLLEHAEIIKVILQGCL